jgi:long-chain acyl-CoA synthetase
MVTYADKPWLNNYDEGVPGSLQPYPELTVHAFLQRSAETHPRNTAVITDTRIPRMGHLNYKISYRELDRLSDAMAVGLLNLGVQKGDRVAIVMPNMAAFVIAFYGVLKIGAVAAATNPSYPAYKMKWQMNNCGAEVVVTMDMYYSTIKEIQPDTGIRHIIVSDTTDYMPRMASVLFNRTKARRNSRRLTVLGEGDFWLKTVLKQYANQQPDVEVALDDAAMLQYTGGLTGKYKGAVLTHRALVAAFSMIHAWLSADIPGVKFKPTHKMTALAALPMFHVFGLVVLLSRAIARTEAVILVPDPRDINGLVSIINHYKPDIFAGVPALYNAILEHSDVRSGKVNMGVIRIAYSGASPLHSDLREEFIELGGRALCEGYGMSETSGGIHSTPLVGEPRPHSVGFPLPDVECAIISLDDGVTEVPFGAVGEIVVRGPHIMTHYHNEPEETAQILRRREDGHRWIFTGDIGYMDDDGHFYIVGRKKNMILIGGFNVYPVQVENVLLMHPAVKEARVLGVPHPRKLGEESMQATIVLKDGESAKKGMLIAHCKNYLASYEIPRQYAFVNEMPLNVIEASTQKHFMRQDLLTVEGE